METIYQIRHTAPPTPPSPPSHSVFDVHGLSQEIPAHETISALPAASCRSEVQEKHC